MLAAKPTPRLAVDIGGTFTDIAIDTGAGIRSAKSLTSRDDPVQGVLRGIAFALNGTGLSPGQFGSIIHGTTLATNALIERQGAKVAVIATRGFRDILEIANERRYDQYDINIGKPDYLVRRDMVFTVNERIGADGTILVPICRDEIEAVAKAAASAGAESIAVCLLHSYKNPVHERAIAETLAGAELSLPLSLSCEVSPEIREFERMCTTVCNAYVKPLMAGYLTSLANALLINGFDCPLLMTTSGGGMTALQTATEFPIRLVESGPSGGAIMAARVATERQLDNVLSFDMGGTTAKICLIENQTPKSSRSFEIDRSERLRKGSGIPVRIPVTEMMEIGAGGGSIARIDSLGRVRVGPQSASSDPGPACYGQGGISPTVTDADVVIGYIDPTEFAENRLTLLPELAHKAIDKSIAIPLGLTTAGGADGVSRTVDEAMANAARIHAVEQGKDLADYTMVAFGGNGPLHAARIADKIGVDRIVIPPNPSVGSAVGFLYAPVSYEIVRTLRAGSNRFPFKEIGSMLREMTETARAIVEAGAPGKQIDIRRVAFMRYEGQGQEVEISLPDGRLDASKLREMIASFEVEYARQFSRPVPGMKVEFINWSVAATSDAPPPNVAHPIESGAKGPETSTHRLLLIGADGMATRTNVFRRRELMPGHRLSGPSLITEPQTTIYVPDGSDAEVDALGNIVLTRRLSTGARHARPDSAMDLQVMWDRLLSIVEEQGQVLVRTAFSPIVRECEDISAGIFDPGGNMLAQAVTGTPGHINTMAETVKLLLQKVDLASMAPGDIYATNDPWIGAGHLNDIVLVAPIFHNGTLAAYSACTSHVYDLGGRGMGPDGADIFDEGLFIPVCRLVERGEVNQLVMEFIRANSRSPVENEGDLYALMACCDVAVRRVSEMLAEFGLGDLEAVGAHILETSARATKEAISNLPRGTYHNELMIDGYEFEITLKVALTVNENEILVDLGGSSGPSVKGINCPLNYTCAYAAFALRCIVGPNVPNNAASLAPFVITAPEGSIVNAQPPSPVAMRHTVGQMVADLVLGALHHAVPDLVPAEGATCLWDLPIRNASLVAATGKATQFATEFCHAGGTGARPTQDGLSATSFPSGIVGTPAEIAETTAPVRYLSRELIPDSGGAGRYRGGLGQRIEMESSESADILLLAGVERTKFGARGRTGGQDGAKGHIQLRSGRTLRGKGEQTIPAGDVLVWSTPGGAGHGDPAKRKPESVRRDVREGVVSAEAARSIYGVVLTADGAVDEEATGVLRGSGMRDLSA